MGFAFSTSAPAWQSLQGRERELAALDAGMRAGKRLITVVGLPGVGKSRLVEELSEAPRRGRVVEAAGSGEALPLGFVDLSAIADSRNLEVEIAQALGLDGATAARLESDLAARGALLVVLDNVDALAPRVAPIVERWLERCPELRILATSIVPLGLDGEARIELGPLATEEAVALYFDGLQRAGIARDELPSSDQVEELVLELDRLPLAIELASSIARVLPPGALLARLAHRFEVLRAAHPGRHASLHDSLRRAFDLLEPVDRRALMRASVFAGGFSLDAAQAILQEEVPVDLVHLLDGLRSRGLIWVEASEQPRFQLPQSVRELAALHLQQSALEEETVRRHMAYFANEGEVHAREIDGPLARAAVLWFGAERENLQAAHVYARSRDPLISLRAGLAFASAFRVQPPLRTELSFLDSLVHVARTLADQELLVRALRLAGAAQASLGLSDLAGPKLEESLQLARAIGSRLEEGFTIVDLCGWVLLPKREFERARLELEQAVAIARGEQSQLLEGVALMRLGVLEGMRFDYEASGKLIHEARSIFRQGGHRFQEGRSLSNLSRVYRGLGRIRQERQVLQEALEIVREMGDAMAEANYLQHQGASELVLGNLDEAETLITRSLEIRHSQADQQAHRARSLGLLGILGLLRGEPKLAVQRLLEAITLSEAAHDSLSRAQFLPFFAAAAATLGRRQEARESLDDARLALREVGDPSADEVCDLLEGVLEFSEARRLAANQREELSSDLEASARARLAAAQLPTYGNKEFVTLAIQLLEKILSGTAGVKRPASSLEVLVGREGAWLEPVGGKRIHLRRRTSLRRLLMALLHQRRAAPGIGLSCDELFAAAWPGEAIHPDSAKARVYTAIWTLRSFGIPISLTGKGEGYILDPKVSIQYAG